MTSNTILVLCFKHAIPFFKPVVLKAVMGALFQWLKQKLALDCSKDAELKRSDVSAFHRPLR